MKENRGESRRSARTSNARLKAARTAQRSDRRSGRRQLEAEENGRGQATFIQNWRREPGTSSGTEQKKQRELKRRGSGEGR